MTSPDPETTPRLPESLRVLTSCSFCGKQAYCFAVFYEPGSGLHVQEACEECAIRVTEEI